MAIERAVRCLGIGLFLAQAVGCGGSEQPGRRVKAQAERAGKPARAPALLSRIPDDSAYVFATVERLPKWYLRREYLASVKKAERVLALLPRASKDELAQLHPAMRVMFELLAELKGKLSEQGLASLGLRIDPHVALYGIGLLPVLRVELLDGDKLRAALHRSLRRAKVKLESREVGRRSYWTFRIPKVDRVAVVVAITKKELIASVVPENPTRELLELTVGTRRPARSLADTGRLQKALERHRLALWGGGYVDSTRLARALVGDVSGVSKSVVQALGLGASDPACKKEIPALAKALPRMVVGFYGLNDRSLSASMIFELRKDLARALTKMVGWAPALSPASVKSARLSIGIGLQIGRFVRFIDQRLAGIASSQYQCSWLDGLREGAREARQGLATLRHPAIDNVSGVNIIIEKMRDGAGGPIDLIGYVLVGTRRPQALVAFVAQQLGVPAPSVKPGAAPIKLPLSRFGNPSFDAYLASGAQSVGVSVGAGTGYSLQKMLARGPIPDGPLLLVHLDSEFVARSEKRDAASKFAGLDPELARALTDFSGASYDKYQDMFFVGHAHELGFEIRMEATYR